MVDLNVKILNENALIEAPDIVGDGGFKIYAIEDIEIEPNEEKNIPLGFSLEIPSGYVCSICETEFNIEVQEENIIRTPIDNNINNIFHSNYNKEIFIKIKNSNKNIKKFSKNELIARMFFVPIIIFDLNVVEGVMFSNNEEEEIINEVLYK